MFDIYSICIAILDNTLFKFHTCNTTHSAYFHHSISIPLTQKYFHSGSLWICFIFSLLTKSIHELQLFQNSAAHIISRTPSTSHITPVL